MSAIAACDSQNPNVARTSFIDAQPTVLGYNSTAAEMVDDGSNYAYNDGPASFASSLNNSATPHDLRDRNNNETESLSSRKAESTRNATKDDENRYSKYSTIGEFAMNSKSNDVEWMRKLARLALDSDCESLDEIANLSLEDSPGAPLAGFVTAIARVPSLIVVKPPMPRDFLLHLGSPVFLQKLSTTAVSNEAKVGRIIDLFGPICEPYYCVEPVKNGIDLVQEGTRLSYAPDHPRTSFVRLEREEGDRYTLLYSQRWSLTLGQREEGSRGDKGISSRDTTEVRPRRRYRRRAVGNSRTTSTGQRNGYKKDPSDLRRETQPKHSYFNY